MRSGEEREKAEKTANVLLPNTGKEEGKTSRANKA